MSSSDVAGRRCYRLGRLGFSVSGSDAILPHLTAEFAALEAPCEEATHVAFEFTRELPRLDQPVLLSPLTVARDAYIAKHGGIEYHVSGTAPALRVRIRSVKRFGSERLAPGWLLRAGSWNHLLPSEKVAKNFMYNVFDYLTQLANLRLGQSYVHASSFERDGRAVAAVAWGGVGKTTALLKLVGEGGWRFLSDDLGLIDDGGTVWRTPKRLQVYAYNVRGQPRIYRALMSRRSPLDRATWHLRERTAGPKRVRRRVSAEELFGPERMARSARLTHALFMERADVPRLAAEPLATDELARRAARTVVRETQPLADLTAAMYSGGAHPVLPTPEQFFSDTYETLRRCLAGIPSHLVRVPMAATPDDLAGYLTTLLDGNE